MNKYDNVLLNHTKGLKMNIGEAAKYAKVLKDAVKK